MKKAKLAIVLAVASLLVSLGGNAALWRVAAKAEENATRSNYSLCAQRDYYVDRKNDSVKFLRDNPDGIQGITPEQIQRSIEGYNGLIGALSVADC